MNYLPLFRRRDFGQLFSDSLQYVIQNARSLYKPLLMYVAPVMAIGGIVSGLFSQDMMAVVMDAIKSLGSGGDPADFLQQMTAAQATIPWWTTPVALLVSLVGSALHGGIVYQHMIMYGQNPDAVEDAEAVRTGAFDLLGKLVTTVLVIGLFVFLYILGYAIISGIFIAIFAPLGALVAIAGMFFMFFLMVPMSLVMVIVMNEGIGPVEGIRRSFAVIKGQWWKVFGLFFVMYLVVIIISSIVSFPATLAIGMGTTAMVISQIVVAAVGVLLTTPLWVAAGMVYFSSTDVAADDHYIDDTIDQIGNPE